MTRTAGRTPVDPARRAARDLQTGEIKDARLKSRGLLDRVFLAVAQQRADEVHHLSCRAP